ncbi:cbb3-type cytochrome c oxidase subunit 3 [soil metagenome]
MFKFIKKYVETMQGVNIYPVISLIIFFVFFVMLLILVKKMKADTVNEISNIPLENESVNTTNL